MRCQLLRVWKQPKAVKRHTRCLRKGIGAHKLHTPLIYSDYWKQNAMARIVQDYGSYSYFSEAEHTDTWLHSIKGALLYNLK
jgi:hypothetical protein